MLNALRLQNFRSLKDTGRLEFRPITILLGQNSSGKSTFLRSLALLRQSVRTRSNAPLLWYGDLVDFGSFREVYSTFADNGEIALTFYIDNLHLANPFYHVPMQQVNMLKNVSVALTLHEISDNTSLKRINITVEDDSMDLIFDHRGALQVLRVNGSDMTKLLPKDKAIFSQSDLIPQILFTEKTRSSYDVFMRPLALSEHEIFAFFALHFDRRVSVGTIRSLARRLSYSAGDKFAAKVDTLKSPLKSWSQVKQNLLSQYSQHGLEELRALYFVGILPELLYSLSSTISGGVRELAYVGPSRATGERYYRHQELAVDQIDPQGQNLAMYLYSLSDNLKKSFSDWLEQQIGYAFQVGRKGGHIQIELREVGSDKFHNMADMGYGFSQILPVMAQIWGRENRSGLQGPASFVVIEQPELHLHPAYQARIADVMAASVRVLPNGRSQTKTRFVVETHSEALINRLGELIYSKTIAPDAVVIYLFHRLPSTEVTEISRSTFDGEGNLQDWPLGFFSAKVR